MRVIDDENNRLSYELDQLKREHEETERDLKQGKVDFSHLSLQSLSSKQAHLAAKRARSPARSNGETERR